MNREGSRTAANRASATGHSPGRVASFAIGGGEMNRHVVRPDLDATFGVHPPHEVFLIEGEIVFDQHAEDVEDMLRLR